MPKPRFFPTPAAFRAWLEDNHASAELLWVGYYKKASKKASVTWKETVDEALCYGWIDGVRQSRDEHSFAIRFSPRKAASVWSRRNIERVEALSAQGRMKASGMAAYAFKDVHPDSGYAVADYQDTLPKAMVAQFKKSKGAWDFYASQPPGYRKQSARWVTSAKREATRERRLATLIEDSGQGLRIKQLRRG